jgi:hypothetical protein
MRYTYRSSLRGASVSRQVAWDEMDGWNLNRAMSAFFERG